jgi:riboflavin biosynthesis pyrimidine reductase
VSAPGRVALETLHDTAGIAETAAERVYGAPLRFLRRPVPYVIANFVATVDGVVSLGLSDGSDAGAVGMRSPADRFVMAMLRAAADVIVIGAATLRASAGHQWTAAGLTPEYAAHLAAYRRALGRPAGNAPLVVVTGSGRLPSHAALSRPETVVHALSSSAGVPEIRAAFPDLGVIAVGDRRWIPGGELVAALRNELNARLVLVEGGPTLVGSLVEASALHELFLTVAPQLAGRDGDHTRPGLLQAFAAQPAALPAATLLSARRAADHLLLRYRLKR